MMDKGYLSQYMVIKGMKDQSRWYTYELDSINKTVKMTSTSDSLDILNLRYTKNENFIEFDGLWNTDTIQIKLNNFSNLSKQINSYLGN